MIASVGDNTVDWYLDTKTPYAGGNGLNVAANLSRLGWPVMYAGAVGSDKEGRFLRSAVGDIGSPLCCVETLEGLTSYSTIIVRPDGDREFAEEFFGVCEHYFPSPACLDKIASAEWVHLGMVRDAPGLRKALASKGCRLSQDCAVSKGVDGLEVAFFSAGDCDEDEAKATASDAVQDGARIAVVTRGAAGSVLYDGQKMLTVPAVATDVVDTTGAGDSYIAGFINEFVRGGGLSDCMEAGATRAAATCRHRGGWRQPGLGCEAMGEFG